MADCSVNLKKDKLSKIIGKVEFFLFRAMEREGLDFVEVVNDQRSNRDVISEDDVKAFKEASKNGAPSEFKSKDEYVSPITGRRMPTPNGAKWVLSEDGYYNLIHEGETLIQGVDLKTGIQVSNVIRLLNKVKNTLIPEYIDQYKKSAKVQRDKSTIQKEKALTASEAGLKKESEKFNEEAQKFEESAQDYEEFAVNLQSLIPMWDQVVANFSKYSTQFNFRTKFSLNDDGMVDLSDVADDEEKMLKKMVFDQPSNEINPVDDVDKSIELYLRSLQMEGEDAFDEYGYTVSVNYSNLVRGLFADLQNTTSMDEIVKLLQEKSEDNPEYKAILKKLVLPENASKRDMDFYIKFRNSFTKAFIPLMTVSIESDDTVKVFAAATGKKGTYEKVIQANFGLRGMPVVVDAQKGEVINLAHRDEDGSWVIDKTDLDKITTYIEKAGPDVIDRKMEFLKAIGFQFSPKTEESIRRDKKIMGNGRYDGFNALYNHLVTQLNENVTVRNNLMNNLKRNFKVKKELKSKGQSNIISDIIDRELKNNRDYNVDYSMVNAAGDRQYAIQLHNNFTILNKFYSDVNAYPTLQSILDEPSMFWMNPETNPSIRNSSILNSLFYFDPLDPNYGARRYVHETKVEAPHPTEKGKTVMKSVYEFSPIKGEKGKPVTIIISNTGGLNTKFDGEKSQGASSTSLNEIDKLLQDMHSFFSSTAYNSMLRLGDKSTDLGISVSHYINPISGKPLVSTDKSITTVNKPLGNISEYSGIFRSDTFLKYITNALKDTVEMKRLAREEDFLQKYKVSGSAILNTWSYFDKILSSETKDLIKTIDDIENNKERIRQDIIKYFEGTGGVVETFLGKFAKAKEINENFWNKNISFENAARYYLANSFVTDLEQMKLFFGDPIFFKDFHKRASKDSATGIFTFVDDNIINNLNDQSTEYGANTNLSSKRLIERVYQEKLKSLQTLKTSDENKKKLREQYKSERDQALSRQTIGKSYRSATLSDVDFKSPFATKIIDNVKKLVKLGHVSEKMQELFNTSLSDVISKKYKGTEADGQGKCTFDFYRIMNILTGQWSSDQERVYKKIVDYAHYDELAKDEINPVKRAEYIRLRDEVGYDPLEAIYFPPKKFQYSGPENNEYGMYVPIFDKFSLQPLIPTNIKGTADEHLAKRMEYNGIGYIKFESGTKTESTKTKDSYYSEYDENNPSERSVLAFKPEQTFKSEQELFFNHFKEQLVIDAEIHDHAIFGSQIRKLIMMNLDKPEFKEHYDNYNRYISHLTELEKTNLYNEMGIERKDGKLKINDMNKLVEYFFKEINKKNQSSNVRKALKYDEATGKFEIPLDATIQAQVLEGIIISAINNRAVRYKTNGSMLTQMAITGSEKTLNRSASEAALKTYGNKELKYYDVVEENGKTVVKPMQVKIGLTGQWLNLLNLEHPDGSKIESLERLNEALKDENWVTQHSRSLQLVAYRIPTQGRNFTDVMQVAQFLPASVGDAIIMPSECVIKSGSDFDIDKMFVFYPNLYKQGGAATDTYTPEELKDPKNYEKLKASIQNKLYNTMSDIILHPSNYIELVTPSDNFHIMPYVDKLYKLLGKPMNGDEHKKTDFANTDILNRNINIDKFISLLKGKSDLGIAAVANTFNVMFQRGKATGNIEFFRDKSLISFMDVKGSVEKNGLIFKSVDYSNIYDEDGVLKSEFFSEFINAFVDAAKDDYVFAVNVVTELSPIMFYMKYMGVSSKKILGLMNQPGIRKYIKTLSVYQNKFVKGEDGYNDNIRALALKDTLKQLGYELDLQTIKAADLGIKDAKKEKDEYGKRQGIYKYLLSQIPTNLYDTLSKYFTGDALFKQVKNENIDISTLSRDTKLLQIAYLLELENLKVQSNSISEAQKVLKYDTSPYASTFDIYQREQQYTSAIGGKNVLSPMSIKRMYSSSIIAPLNVSEDIKNILEQLFPVRNNDMLNKFLLLKGQMHKEYMASEYKKFLTDDDLMKMARVAKNDMMNYILQNYFDESETGKEYFKQTFNTDKSLNDYLLDLIQGDTLVKQWEAIKNSEDFEDLAAQFPMVRNIILEKGEKNGRIKNFRILENSANPVEKEQMIQQFEDITNLQNKEISGFFKNLALYSVFQSGMNTTDYSYMSIVPASLVNKLYGSAVDEYNKLSGQQKEEMLRSFYNIFKKNNPEIFNLKPEASLTREISKRGKWYSEDKHLKWAAKSEKEKTEPKPEVIPEGVVAATIPQNKVSGVESHGALVEASDAVKKILGPAPTSIDMIEAGLRTRTTRSTGEMEKYAVKVGDIIKNTGISADGSTKVIYARVTAIHPQNSPGWRGTWEKEGWRKEDVEVTNRFKTGAAAIEFEIIKPSDKRDKSLIQPTVEPIVEKKVVSLISKTTSERIDDFTTKNNIDIAEYQKQLGMTKEELFAVWEYSYNEEKIGNQTIEEFLRDLLCD